MEITDNVSIFLLLFRSLRNSLEFWMAMVLFQRIQE